jgi:polyphosphate kinase
VIVPVDDVLLHSKLHSLLLTSLSDNREAWDLSPDGTYTQRTPGLEPVRATQEIFLTDPWGGAPAEPVAEEPRAAQPSHTR